MRIRSIPGAPGYKVADDGEVYGKRGYALTQWESGNKPHDPKRRRHLKVDVGPAGRRYVHHLVAEVFLGPRPEGADIRHLDGDPWNNRVENLAYGTRSENVRDSIAHGTYRNNNAEKTVCPRGHAYDTANTYVDPRGRRRCRTCRKGQR